MLRNYFMDNKIMLLQIVIFDTKHTVKIEHQVQLLKEMHIFS